jgi:hypothetical protein
MNRSLVTQILGSTDNDLAIDAKTLLQLDGSMIVGALFLLTLSTFISGPASTARFLTGYFTLFVIVPFITSGLLIIFGKSKDRIRARFVAFVFYLVLILVIPALPPIHPVIEDTEQQCAENPRSFNVSANPWKCSKFSGGSLAEQCARNPERYGVAKSDCADFIPPSS